MANESPTQLAREAKHGIDLLKQEVELLTQRFEGLELLQLRERVKALEEQANQSARRGEEIDRQRGQIAVLEDRVGELKRVKEEADKRHWQFVYILAGALASLLVTVVVQLVLAILKRP